MKALSRSQIEEIFSIVDQIMSDDTKKIGVQSYVYESSRAILRLQLFRVSQKLGFVETEAVLLAIVNSTPWDFYAMAYDAPLEIGSSLHLYDRDISDILFEDIERVEDFYALRFSIHKILCKYTDDYFKAKV